MKLLLHKSVVKLIFEELSCSSFFILAFCKQKDSSRSLLNVFLEGIGWSNIALNSSLFIEFRRIFDFTIHSKTLTVIDIFDCDWFKKLTTSCLGWLCMCLHKVVVWKVCRSSVQILHVQYSSCLVKNFQISLLVFLPFF